MHSKTASMLPIDSAISFQGDRHMLRSYSVAAGSSEVKPQSLGDLKSKGKRSVARQLFTRSTSAATMA